MDTLVGIVLAFFIVSLAILLLYVWQRRNYHQGGVVVSDTSVITNLANIRKLALLRILYGRIIVPPRVWREMRRFTPRNRGVLSIRFAWWIRSLPVKQEQRVVNLLAQEPGLDRGEAEAIILAGEVQARLLLIDEAKGRQVAQKRGLLLRGLLGVLIEAKNQGLISEVKPLIMTLRKKHGFRISDALYEKVLQQAGE
jgi:uncharacterized protein